MFNCSPNARAHIHTHTQRIGQSQKDTKCHFPEKKTYEYQSDNKL